jgi:CheY-like chemotaxis protein/chemotaxis protein CheY-P-specific phosphatase CheC
MSHGLEKKRITFPKLENLLGEAIKRISTDCSTLIGKQIIFDNYYFDVMTLDTFLSQNKINYMLVKAVVEEGYKGCLYMLLPVKDAIAVSGLLLAIDEQQIREQTKEETLDGEYLDAFNEFGSQACGLLDGTFRKNLPKPIHIKQSQSTLFNLQKAEEFPPELLKDEYVALTSDMTIPGFDKGKFFLFIPRVLGETFYEETGEIEEEDEGRNYIGVVLVVNPVPTEVKAVRGYLVKGQYKVLTSKDGITAIKTLQKEKVDLILMDIELPKEDGISVCQRIRRNLLTEEIPIVMCSSSPTQQQVIDSIKSGAQDFVVKPIDVEKLLEKVGKNMMRKSEVSVLN